MDRQRLAARLTAAVFGRMPSPERLEREAPLRAELFRKVVRGTVAFLVIQGALLISTGTAWTQLIWTTLEPAGFVAMAWITGRRQTRLGVLFLLIGLSHAAGFTQARFPASDWPSGLLAVTIVIAGLLVGAYFVRLWTAICCGVVFWVRLVEPGPAAGWTAAAVWCGVFVATAALVELFSRHLERLLDASRVAEEQKRSAVVAERTRFARDIHDTLAQGFTGIVTQLNAAEQRVPEGNEARTHIEKARALARGSLEEARRSVQALRPGALAEGSLLESIERIGRGLTADSEVQLETGLEGQPYALDEQTEANLLRIAQEAMTNAVRHSGAGRIGVRLAYRTGSVQLAIGDTGCGMSGAEVAGMGLDGMRARALQIRGEIRIATAPGAGTQIIVTVPHA